MQPFQFNLGQNYSQRQVKQSIKTGEERAKQNALCIDQLKSALEVNTVSLRKNKRQNLVAQKRLDRMIEHKRFQATLSTQASSNSANSNSPV